MVLRYRHITKARRRVTDHLFERIEKKIQRRNRKNDIQSLRMMEFTKEFRKFKIRIGMQQKTKKKVFTFFFPDNFLHFFFKRTTIGTYLLFLN